MKYIVLFLVSLILLCSCEDLVKDFEIEKKPAKIVLNTSLSPDSIIEVHLSKSLSIYDNDSIRIIPNADVFILDELDNTYKLEYFEKGLYSGPSSIIKPGQSYIVKAKADNFKEVQAIVEIPSKPEIISFDTTFISHYVDPYCLGCTYTTSALLVSYKIKKPANSKNFYKFSIETDSWEYVYKDTMYEDNYGGYFYSSVIVDSTLRKDKLYIQPNESYVDYTGDDYFSIATPDYVPRGEVIYFSDKLNQSDQLEFSFTIELSYYSLGTYIYMNLQAVNEDYYKFIGSLARSEEAEYNPLAESITIYNNIENGLGTAYGYSSVMHQLDISDLMDKVGNDY